MEKQNQGSRNAPSNAPPMKGQPSHQGMSSGSTSQGGNNPSSRESTSKGGQHSSGSTNKK